MGSLDAYMRAVVAAMAVGWLLETAVPERAFRGVVRLAVGAALLAILLRPVAQMLHVPWTLPFPAAVTGTAGPPLLPAGGWPGSGWGAQDGPGVTRATPAVTVGPVRVPLVRVPHVQVGAGPAPWVTEQGGGQP